MNAQVQTELDSVVIFRLGGSTFATAVDSVREVVPIAWLSKPPQMPSFVQGMLDLGGVAVPVLRLDALLRVDDAHFGLDASILILRGEPCFGLLVQHVDGVRRAAGLRFSPVAPEHSVNGLLSGILDDGGSGIPLLDCRQILLTEERLRLEEFQAHIQDRLAELTAVAP